MRRSNELLKAMITDIDEFVEDAVSAFGRGHFLSSYDGEENEEENIIFIEQIKGLIKSLP